MNGNRSDFDTFGFLAVDGLLAFSYAIDTMLKLGLDPNNGTLLYEQVKKSSFPGIFSPVYNFNTTNGDAVSLRYSIVQFHKRGKFFPVYGWNSGILEKKRELLWSSIPHDGSCPGDCSVTNGECQVEVGKCSCSISFSGIECDTISPAKVEPNGGTYQYTSISKCETAAYFYFEAGSHTLKFVVELETGVGTNGTSRDNFVFVEKGNTTVSQSLINGSYAHNLSFFTIPTLSSRSQTIDISTINDTDKGMYSITVIPTGRSCPSGYVLRVSEVSTANDDCK